MTAKGKKNQNSQKGISARKAINFSVFAPRIILLGTIVISGASQISIQFLSSKSLTIFNTILPIVPYCIAAFFLASFMRPIAALFIKDRIQERIWNRFLKTNISQKSSVSRYDSVHSAAEICAAGGGHPPSVLNHAACDAYASFQENQRVIKSFQDKY